MIRWSPNSELANLHTAMDRLFQDFFGPGAGGGEQSAMPSYVLSIDVKEVEGGYQVQAPVPGFKPEEVEVTFADGVLRIQASHSQETRKEEGGYLRREVSHGNYQRSVQLPGDVEADRISADFENGVLTVSVPRMPRPQPTKIKVSSGGQKQLAGAAKS